MLRRSMKLVSLNHNNNSGLDTIEKEELRQKRKNKQTRFAWLARFLRGGRPGPETLRDKGILMKPEACYFGIPVTAVCSDASRLEENVPRPVYCSATALRGFLETEGIFRVSGIFSEMNRMKECFEGGNTPDFANVDSRHSIAGLLELWFRELPEPITTHAMYDEFMNCLGDDISEEQAYENLKVAVERLPKCNQIVLCFLLKFMREVASYEEQNKMGTKNLGVVFGSILLGSAVLCFSLGLKATLERQNQIVQMLIERVDYVFPTIKFTKFFNEE